MEKKWFHSLMSFIGKKFMVKREKFIYIHIDANVL